MELIHATASVLAAVPAEITLGAGLLNAVLDWLKFLVPLFATVVFVFCAIGYMGARGVSPQNATKFLQGMIGCVVMVVLVFSAKTIIDVFSGVSL